MVCADDPKRCRGLGAAVCRSELFNESHRFKSRCNNIIFPFVSPQSNSMVQWYVEKETQVSEQAQKLSLKPHKGSVFTQLSILWFIKSVNTFSS